MEQLSFVISPIVFSHLLLSHHVLLVKMRILDSLDFLDLLSATCYSKFAGDILILRGAWARVTVCTVISELGIGAQDIETKISLGEKKSYFKF